MSMMSKWIATVLMVAVGTFANAQESGEGSVSIGQLRARGLNALLEEKNDEAIKAADAMVAAAGKDPRVMRAAGDLYLRAGKVSESTKWFNRFVKEVPAELPYLWQRGISLYFTGDYQAGVEQFEKHRKVNPNDVENAAWHFLCVAKAKSVEEAKRLVLPAPGDSRLPMDEVLAMLSSGDTEAVVKRVEATKEGTDERAYARFYGDFYLGLYADAHGDKKKAIEYLERCAKDAPHNYMGDVARVYAQFLTKE